MPYEYNPIYGVEPYLPLQSTTAEWFGGGAKRTEQNALVTLWTMDTIVGGIPTSGRLLKPRSYNPVGAQAVIDAEADGILHFEKAWEPVENARDACKLSITRSDSEGGDNLTPFLLAIINPTPELKNAISKSLRARVDAGAPFGYTIDVLRAALQAAAFTVDIVSPGNQPQISDSSSGGPFFFGGTVLIANTDGSDGTYPEIYPYTDPSAVSAINRVIQGGDYCIPFFIPQPNDNSALNYTIAWDHSPARR
jgi:hypothetical protein